MTADISLILEVYTADLEMKSQRVFSSHFSKARHPELNLELVSIKSNTKEATAERKQRALMQTFTPRREATPFSVRQTSKSQTVLIGDRSE